MTEELEQLKMKLRKKMTKSITIAAITILVLAVIDALPFLLMMFFADENTKVQVLSMMLTFSIPALIFLIATAGLIIYSYTSNERKEYKEKLKKFKDQNDLSKY